MRRPLHALVSELDPLIDAGIFAETTSSSAPNDASNDIRGSHAIDGEATVKELSITDWTRVAVAPQQDYSPSPATGHHPHGRSSPLSGPSDLPLLAPNGAGRRSWHRPGSLCGRIKPRWQARLARTRSRRGADQAKIRSLRVLKRRGSGSRHRRGRDGQGRHDSVNTADLSGSITKVVGTRCNQDRAGDVRRPNEPIMCPLVTPPR